MSGQLKRVPSGGPFAMLDDEQYATWNRLNNESFDKLPSAIREAIQEAGVDTDNTKLLKCLEIGIPELSIIGEIWKRAREAKDGGADFAANPGFNPGAANRRLQ